MSSLIADVNDLNSRLRWGQPALTIIDVRDRLTYNQSHITGAISIPLDDLANRANSSLQKEREIYVYGDDDSQAGRAAVTLRSNGFRNVSQLSGGLSAWKNVGGATEGLS